MYIPFKPQHLPEQKNMRWNVGRRDFSGKNKYFYQNVLLATELDGVKKKPRSRKTENFTRTKILYWSRAVRMVPDLVIFRINRDSYSELFFERNYYHCIFVRVPLVLLKLVQVLCTFFFFLNKVHIRS